MAKKPLDQVETKIRGAVKRRQEDVPTQRRPAVARHEPPPAEAARLLDGVAFEFSSATRLDVRAVRGVRTSQGEPTTGYVLQVEGETIVHLARIGDSLLKALAAGFTFGFEHHFEVIARDRVCAYVQLKRNQFTIEDAEGTPHYTCPKISTLAPVVEANTGRELLTVSGTPSVRARPVKRGARTLGWVTWQRPTAFDADPRERVRGDVELHASTPPYDRALSAIAVAMVHANDREVHQRQRHSRGNHGWKLFEFDLDLD